MTGYELMKESPTTKINDSLIDSIESKYGKIDDTFVKQLLSVHLDDNFLDGDDILRLLSSSEILSANENLGVNFTEKRIIPLFDIGDNDFIVYLITEQKWALMNIVDESVFSKEDDLSKFFN